MKGYVDRDSVVASSTLVGNQNQSSAVIDDHLRWLLGTVPGFSYRCLLDEHWTMLVMTDQVEAMTGYPASDFIDNAVRSYESIIFPEDTERVTEVVHGAAQTDEPYYLEYRIVHRCGDVRWVLERGRASRDENGEIVWLDGYIVDSTEARELRGQEEERKESVRRQQQALVTLATSVAVGGGRIAEACELATALVSHAVDIARVSVWLLDETRTRLRLVDLYQQADNSHQSGLVLTAGQYPAYFEAMSSGRLVDADDANTDPRTREFSEGYLRPLSISSMLDAALRVAGEVVGVLCLEHVGQMRCWEDHEKNFAGEIADQISHCLLNEARQEAQEQQEALQEQLFRSQKLEAVGRLAGGIAHDFNNLLTIIGGFAEQVIESLPDGANKEDLLEVRTATARATDLTAQLLTFSRKENVKLESMNLTSSLGSIKRMLRRLISDNVGLSLELDPTPLFVCANEGLIHQMLTNLVVNAQDAIERNGDIVVRLAEEELHEGNSIGGAHLAPGPYACLSVTDNGVGIAPDVLSSIFEPFFTTKGASAGTGLGLSTVYGIVQKFRGGIDVESVKPGGTTFRIYLPIVDNDVVKPASPAVESPLQLLWGANRRVLVAEDNRAVLELISRALLKVGFDVEAALGTPAAMIALQAARNDPSLRPDLILSDMAMPGGGGLRVLEWRDEHLPDVPVGFISGYMSEDEARAIEHYSKLQKPFAANELLPFVEGLLRK